LQRQQTLDRLLLGESPTFPGFKLVVTGHSLGAGIGGILLLLLSPKFEGLRCLCYSPPGCVMSSQACSQHNITSFVLESDIVPRMSYHSMVGLRNDVLEAIARIKVPKHVAMTANDSNEGDLDLVHLRDSISESAFYRRVCEFYEHQSMVEQMHRTHNVTLHIPGRIVHIIEAVVNKSKSGLFRFHHPSVDFIPVWAKREDFSVIEVAKSVTMDHNPERMQRVLETLTSSLSVASCDGCQHKETYT
jgi:sn1-specific diacylglycerol lipase